MFYYIAKFEHKQIETKLKEVAQLGLLFARRGWGLRYFLCPVHVAKEHLYQNLKCHCVLGGWLLSKSPMEQIKICMQLQKRQKP